MMNIHEHQRHQRHQWIFDEHRPGYLGFDPRMLGRIVPLYPVDVGRMSKLVAVTTWFRNLRVDPG